MMFQHFPNRCIPVGVTSWFIRTLVFLIAFLALSTNSGNPNPAVKSYSGCTLKPSSLKGCKSESNEEIQMGEAWANTRVQSQKIAFFEVYKPGEKNYGSEGGPYGKVTAFDCWPTEADLVASTDPANWCFLWNPVIRPKRKNVAKSETSPNTTMPTKIPGEEGTPMPLICPHNLKNCYSAEYFEAGGPLEAYADIKPTYTGVWFPPETSNGSAMFCQGLNLGCPTPTMRQLQLQHLAEQNCSVSECQKGGNSTKLH